MKRDRCSGLIPQTRRSPGRKGSPAPGSRRGLEPPVPSYLQGHAGDFGVLAWPTAGTGDDAAPGALVPEVGCGVDAGAARWSTGFREP
jgi:hypothetical protein